MGRTINSSKGPFINYVVSRDKTVHLKMMFDNIERLLDFILRDWMS